MSHAPDASSRARPRSTSAARATATPSSSCSAPTSALVEHVLGRLVGPVADLEDLTQTVFLEAMTALSRFRGDASFKTWLLSIAVHVGQHYLRAGKIRRHVPLDLVPEEAILEHPDHDRMLDERSLGAGAARAARHASRPRSASRCSCTSSRAIRSRRWRR